MTDKELLAQEEAARKKRAKGARYEVNRTYGPDTYGGSNASKKMRTTAKTSKTPTEDKRARMEEEGRDLYSPSTTGSSTYTPASTSSPKANAKYVPMDTADNQYAQALAAFNPGGTFVPRAAQEEIAARKAANRSRYMDALDTSTRAGVAAAGSGTVRPVMDTSETQAIKNEWAGKMAAREKDRTNAGGHFRSVRGNDDYRDRVLGFDTGALPYGRTDTARLRYALDEDYRGQIDTFNQRQGLLENPYDNLKYLTDEERRDLRYYASRGEYDRANEYLDYLAPDLNARMQGIASNEMARLSEEQPVAGVLANIAASREAGLGVLPTIRGAVKEQMGIYEPVDTNSRGFRAAHMLRDTTEGVGNAAYNAAGGGIAGDTARFLAEAGLSAAQNASMLPMGPTAPLVFMGSMAAGQSALDTLENGGSAQDALKIAVAMGIIETATEKIGVDEFFRVSRLGKKGIQQLLKDYKLGKPLVNNIKSFAGDLGTQMAAEGAEEMIAEVAENLADTAIRGDNGQYAQLVQTYMANGMSEEQAKARAFTDMYIDNVLKAGAQGALAGGMLGVGGATIGTRYNNEVTAVGAELAELDITPQQLITAVQQSGSKDAQDFARELSRKLVLGQEVTLADMGRLHLLSNNYITSKDYEAVQKAAIAEEEAARNAGGNVRESEQNLRGSEAAARVQQGNVGNAAETQQGEPQQRSQNQPAEAQNATNAQTAAIDVASKATNNTESIEPTAGQANGRYAPKTMGVYAWDGELSAKLTPEEQAAIKRTNAQPYQSGRKGNRVLITWADEHGAVAEHWFSAGDIYFDGPTSWVQGGRGFSVDYDEIGKNVSQKELKALRRTPTTPSVVGVDKGKGVAYVEWRDENGNTVAKASFSTFDLGISSEWAEENFDWAEGNGSVGLPKEKPSSQAQSSAAQTATGNTAANTETNEANAEGRSETAAQTKTVAETSWENIQKIVQTKAKGGLSQKDEYTMNREGRRAFDRIGRALGVEIHFVDRIVNEEGEANGLYQNGHIFIARNAENPYHIVLAHEITHHFEKTAPEVYEKFKGAALKMNPGLVEKYMAMWGYDEAVAEFEVAADFAGELLEKEGTVKRVIKEDISAARGFHRAMNAVFDKVRGDDTKGLTEEEKKLDAQLDAARDMWRRCLRETRDERKEGGESKGQYSRKREESLQKELIAARAELEKLETASEKITVPVYEGEKYIETRPDGRRRWTKDINKATRMTERNREKLAAFAGGVKQIGERETERAKPAPYAEIKRARDRIAELEKEIRAAERGYNSAAEAREAESKTAAVRTQKELATYRDSFFNKKARKGEPFYDDKGNTSYQSMVRTIVAEAKRQGAEEVHHSAKSGSKFATSLYLKKGDYEIRISDHSLPPTDERESRNFKSRWNDEFILDASERSALAWMVKTQADLTRLVAGMFDRNTNTHELIDRAYDNWLDNIHGKQTEPQMSRKLTPEQRKLDEDYMAAVERGDMETAQRMVDEAAKLAMPNSKITDEEGNLLRVYHGTSEDFTVFDKTKGRANMDIQGMFFSPWEIDAEGYGDKVGAYYLNITKPANESAGYRALNKFKGRNGAGVKAREHLESLGFDGVNNGDEEFIAFNPNQIKSADPVTYDDNGEVISLSERFNEKKDDIRFSKKSTFAAAGLTVKMKQNGEPATDSNGRMIATNAKGRRVERVTTEMIENSGIGAIINYALNKKRITEEDARKQKRAAVRLLNLMLKTQDAELVWNFVGATMMSSLRTNSDKQYGTTIDFSTVCRKTIEMLRATSTAMKRLERGLTKAEIVQIQGDVLAEGGIVNCPVCYVFSRWAGVGGLLDNMNKWQKKYADRSWDNGDKLAKHIEQLKSLTANKKELRKFLSENDGAYMEFKGQKEQNEADIKAGKKRIREIAKEISALEKNGGESVEAKNTVAALRLAIAEIEENNQQLTNKNNVLKAQIKAIENAGNPEVAWLERVRSKPDYWEHGYVAPQKLFDLEDAAYLVKNKPLAWGYRTSRGPALGKAILPYSDMWLGDFFLSPGRGEEETSLFAKTENGQFNKDQLKKIEAKAEKVLAQNLIGGQRFQSTSDFRYDYALDYLLAFWQLQAVGSYMQTYTKIIEFAEMASSVGGDVNMSLMPLDKGYDDNGKLIFSTVTGIDPDAAFALAARADSAQTILVGINDRHIELALEDGRIGFVIPYHMSGASVEFIRGLLANLKEEYNEGYYKEYANVQTDHVISVPFTGGKAKAEANKKREAEWMDAIRANPSDPAFGDNAPSEAQRSALFGQYLREIRKAILTEGDGLNETQIKYLQSLAESAEDIKGKSFEELRDIEEKALAGDKDAQKQYRAWSAGFLLNTYNKMWVDKTKTSTYGVRLSAGQAGSVMPHEYWDTDTTVQNAYVNGFLFRSYCYNLGLMPRFTGKLSSGKSQGYGDFSNSRGYWKLLIDRPMYANNGAYRDQQAINATWLTPEKLTPEYGREKWGETSGQMPNTARADRAAERFVARETENGGKTSPQLSRKGQDAAMRRANRLARENARLKGQFKLTKGVKLRESDIRKVTRDLLKDYEIIDFDKDELERHIRAMAEAAQAADESNADKTWESIRNVARGLSRYVGRAAFARYADADEEYDADLVRETYEDIRRHLGRQRVLSPWFKDPWVENESPQRKEMRDYYRRKLFGVLTLTSDRSVDKGPLGDIGKLYEELTETFGEAYFPSDVTNGEDQIIRIADVLDDLKDTLTMIGERTPVTVAEDVEQSSRDETRRAAYEDEVYGEFYAALEKDILLRITEIRAEKPTFADKEKAKRDALKDKHKSRVQSLKAEIQQNRTEAQEALREAKAQKREALQELKDKYKAKTAEARERQNARELRRKIEKYTKDLYKTLAKPTNEKHINEDVRPAAALLISLINQESNFETDPATGKRVSRGGATRKAQLAGVGLDIDLPNILTKRTEAARKMKKAAEQIFAGEDNYLLIYDPELMENLAIMEDWSDKPLVTMSSAELQVVWDAVRGVKHMITQSRKVFNEGRQWEVGALASGLVRDVDLNNPRRTIKYGAAASVDKLLNIDQLTPQAYFHRFGEGGDRLFRMLRRSQDKYVRIIADIQARTAEVIKDIDIDKLNKDIATYKVKGGDVTLSRAQVLLLYASIKREQAAGHILGGGIKAKPLKGKGLFETKQLLPVEVTQEDLDNMFKEAKLTEAEKKAADGLVNIMSTVLAEYGNEASLRTYGYAKFREGWYVPIETDPTSNKTDNNDPLFKQFTAAASIAGRGFAKQTKEGAKNAIMVGSLFDVYAKHVNDMAMYAAYVETLENMRRVRNFKFKDGTKTQNYIEALLTQAGVAYWDKLINDINGGERLKNDDFSFDRFVGAYKAAAVSANIRVILQQPTAIIRAAAEINPAYLIAAMRKIPKRHEWERIKNNVGIAQWKDWGYFDINTGRQMRDVVLGTDSLFEKFKQAGMRPMSGADSFAWTLLYHACEDEAKAKGLRPGSAAFDSFVASRFSDIIDKTQVVDGVLQRSQIMRSTNAVTKMATSFMAEPTKTYNMFLSAVWDFRHARSKTERQAARKKLGFTVAALVVSFLTNAAAQSLIDALRDDDRDKEFLDKFWDAYLGRPEEDDKNKAVTVMGGNLWTAFNPVTYIPFFKDIVSLVQGYSTKRMDMESIGRVIDAAEQAWAASKGEGKQTAFARAMTLASEVSRAFGLPLANIKRDSVAVLNTIAQEKKDYGMMYNVDRAFYKLDKNVSRYVDIMLKAHDSGDTETEKRITDDLHAAGVDDKKIKDAADKIRQKQQNVDSVTEIKDRYRTYSEAASYNKLESYAKSTSTYKSANAKERSKYEALLNDALANNSDAQKRHEKAQKAGVSDNLYMEALVASQIADRTEGNNNWDKSSKPSQPEAEAAIDRLARDHALSQTQKYNLWMSLTGAKTDKNNPYK